MKRANPIQWPPTNSSVTSLMGILRISKDAIGTAAPYLDRIKHLLGTSDFGRMNDVKNKYFREMMVLSFVY